MPGIQERLGQEGISWRTLNRLSAARVRTVVDTVYTPGAERTAAQQKTIVNVKRLEEKNQRRMRGANTAEARVNGGYLSGGQPRGHGKKS